MKTILYRKDWFLAELTGRVVLCNDNSMSVEIVDGKSNLVVRKNCATVEHGKAILLTWGF